MLSFVGYVTSEIRTGAATCPRLSVNTVEACRNRIHRCKAASQSWTSPPPSFPTDIFSNFRQNNIIHIDVVENVTNFYAMYFIVLFVLPVRRDLDEFVSGICLRSLYLTLFSAWLHLPYPLVLRLFDLSCGAICARCYIIPSTHSGHFRLFNHDSVFTVK